MRATGVPYILTPAYISFKNARILVRFVLVIPENLCVWHLPFAQAVHVSPHVHPSTQVHFWELHFSHEHPFSHSDVFMSANTRTFIKKCKKSTYSEILHKSCLDPVSIYVKLPTDMNPQPSAPDQPLVNDVCQNLQEYLHAFDNDMPMLTLKYIQDIKDENAIVEIVNQMLGDMRHLTNAAEVLQSPEAQNIVRVWRAVKQKDPNTISLINEEITRLRRQCLLPAGPTPKHTPHAKGPQFDLDNTHPSSIVGPTFARMRALLAWT